MQTRASIPVTLCLLVAACGPLPDVDWPVNGGVDNIRYSPLSEITRDNVGQLQVAWTYDSQDAFEGSEMQSNPIVVDGVLYATTPTLKVVALNAETGRYCGPSTRSPRAARRGQERGIVASRFTTTGCSLPPAAFFGRSTGKRASQLPRSDRRGESTFGRVSADPPRR